LQEQPVSGPSYFLFRCGQSKTYAIAKEKAAMWKLPKDPDGRRWKFISRLPAEKLGPYSISAAALLDGAEFHVFKAMIGL
jgi:hypothetical protein